MSNNNIEQQFELAKQAAHRAGIGGTAYIDYNPPHGFLRIKLDVTPPEFRNQLISNFASALEQGCLAFGLRIKVHQSAGTQPNGEK